MDGKPILSSRTLWANIVALVATYLGLYHAIEVPVEAQAEVVAAVMTGMNIAMRFITSEPVKLL